MIRIKYDFKNGPLDQLLDRLIGASREAKIEERIRKDMPVIKGTSIDPRRTIVSENGIFLSMGQGRFRTFLYLTNSRVMSFGLPKRHYFSCEKVQEGFPYVHSNMDEVTVTCIESGNIHKNVILDVCGYCSSIFREKTSKILTGKSFEDFILDMEENETTKTTKIGNDGYVINWNEISTALRKSRNFTCERCGIQIQDPNYRKFMHVHHIDYNKLNNKHSNLQCLCILCHSRVDGIHRQNFSSPYQQREIRKFREVFENA